MEGRESVTKPSTTEFKPSGRLFRSRRKFARGAPCQALLQGICVEPVSATESCPCKREAVAGISLTSGWNCFAGNALLGAGGGSGRLLVHLGSQSLCSLWSFSTLQNRLAESGTTARSPHDTARAHYLALPAEDEMYLAWSTND